MDDRENLGPRETSYSRGAFLDRAAKAAGGLAIAATVPSVRTAHAAPVHAETVKIRLQNWFSQTDMSAWQVGLDMVKKAYPNIEVSLEYVDYGDTAVKVIAAAVAGNVPDVIMCATDHTPALVTAGMLMDLNPLIAKYPSVNAKDFFPGVSSGFNMGGHWWGLPFDNSSEGIYYNKRMFDAAKIGYPPPASRPNAWTFDEFVVAAQALTKPNGKQWGVSWGSPPWWGHYPVMNFVYMEGGRLFSTNPPGGLGACIVNSPQTAKGVQNLVDLIHKYKVAPTVQDLGSSSNGIDFFASGLSAMLFDGQFDLITYEKGANFPFDVGYFPLGKVKRLGTGGSGFAISASTKHPQEAWQFVSQFTSAKVLATMIGTTGRSVPARRSAASSFAGAAKAKGIKYADIFVTEDAYTQNDLLSIAENEFLTYWATEMEPVFTTGKGDIPAALAKIERQTNAVIQKKAKTAKVKL